MNPRTIHARKIKRSFIALSTIFFVIAIGFSFGFRANSDRIQDIQESRVDACKQTYSGMREVFQPLFTDPPQTPRRIRRTKLFNESIDRLIENCNRQSKSE